MEQITINYEEPLTGAYETCREYIAHRMHHQGRSQKAIAADMDYSPSHLSRKCAQSPDDSMRFTLDDLERFIQVTGDVTPVIYLAEKYLRGLDEVTELRRALREAEGRLAKTQGYGRQS